MIGDAHLILILYIYDVHVHTIVPYGSRSLSLCVYVCV